MFHEKEVARQQGMLALRVIQAQGQFAFKWLVKKSCKWVRKMKISQTLYVQLRPEQFSPQGEVKTYPEMHSLCPSMRFRKNPLAE